MSTEGCQGVGWSSALCVLQQCMFQPQRFCVFQGVPPEFRVAMGFGFQALLLPLSCQSSVGVLCSCSCWHAELGSR